MIDFRVLVNKATYRLNAFHLIFLLLLPAACSRAQGPVFYISTLNKQLLKIDINNCDTTFVGLTAVDLLDIAMTPDNRLYGINGWTLVEIDTSTAALTTIAMGIGGNSLVSDSAGNLLTVGADSIYQINRFTGNKINLGYFGNYSSAGDLTFYHDTLYLSADNNQLVRIFLNPVPSSQFVGFMAANAIFGINTICINNVETMVASAGSTTSGTLYTVNPGNAALGLLCDTIVHTQILGATSQVDYNAAMDCAFFSGIQQPLTDEDVVVFPNPANDILHINVPGYLVIKAVLYNMVGLQVYMLKESGPLTMHTGSIANGVYMLEILTTEGLIRKKLVINHSQAGR